MKETAEKIIELGFGRSPKKLLDEVEIVTADMVRRGWSLTETLVEESLGHIHLFFDRDVDESVRD